MKILFVIPEFGSHVQGGISRFYKHSRSGLIAAGHEVNVCVANESYRVPDDENMLIRGLDAKAVDQCERGLKHFDLTPDLRRQLARAAAAFEQFEGGAGYDVVEVTDWGMLYFPWLTRAPRKAAIIVQLHGSSGQVRYHDPLEGEELSSLLTRMIETAILPRADALHTYGEQNAREWKALLGRDVNWILPAWKSTSVSGSKQTLNYGLVASRLQVWKGPEVLCSAYKYIQGEPPIVLWAGGDQPYRSLKQTMSCHLRSSFPNVWGRFVIPIGGHSPTGVAAMQSAAKFYMHPSSWEVFGFSVVEAMAAGKVVVCSEESGASALIEHGVNGFKFKASDPRQLATVLETVRDMNDEATDAMGLLARQAVSEALEPANITRIRISHYQATTRADNFVEHDWTKNVFSPCIQGDALTILNQIPARLLIGNLWRRLKQRFSTPGNTLRRRPIALADASPEIQKLIKDIINPAKA